MREVLQTGGLILGILCFIYYGAIVLYAGITADFAWIWPVLGSVLLVLRQGSRYVSVHPDSRMVWLLRLILVLTAIGILVSGWICGHIIGGMTAKPRKNLEYVIVLGAQVRGTVPSKALRKRLDCAAAYAAENPDTIVFLSGGKGSGEEITEAEAMARYLTEEKGLNPERLVCEDRSTTTWENLKFCAELREIRACSVGILSNDFHVYRASGMAARQGYQNTVMIPAPSDALMQPHYVLREVCAVLAAVARGQMTV